MSVKIISNTVPSVNLSACHHVFFIEKNKRVLQALADVLLIFTANFSEFNLTILLVENI